MNIKNKYKKKDSQNLKRGWLLFPIDMKVVNAREAPDRSAMIPVRCTESK